MIIPYTERDALIQAPVYYKVGSETVLIYPLRLGDIIKINGFVRYRYVLRETAGSEYLDDEVKQEFIDDVIERLTDFDFLVGDWHRFFLSDLPSLVYYVRHILRSPSDWDDERIVKVFFPNGITDLALIRIAELRLSLHCDTPPIPKLNITDKPPRYEPTNEEQIARVYKSLADKFHWTYEQVMNLTEYQVYWYMHLFPEEREHIEEMDEMAHKNDRGGVTGTGTSRIDVPYQPNTLHFNTPEEYEAWLEKRRGEK